MSERERFRRASSSPRSLLIAVALSSRAAGAGPLPRAAAAVAVADAGSGPELLSDVDPVDDASLTLVASLTDGVDLETAREAGLAPRGSAEHAVTHMSDRRAARAADGC